MIIKADQFQYLFRIEYAFTTHSSQGLSIDKSYTIHEFNTDAISCTFEDDIFPFELIDDKT